MSKKFSLHCQDTDAKYFLKFLKLLNTLWHGVNINRSLHKYFLSQLNT
jgi:hypothetical protein